MDPGEPAAKARRGSHFGSPDEFCQDEHCDDTTANLNRVFSAAFQDGVITFETPEMQSRQPGDEGIAARVREIVEPHGIPETSRTAPTLAEQVVLPHDLRAPELFTAGEWFLLKLTK